MTVNVSPTPNLPPMPSNEQELLQWAQWLSTALNNYFKIAYEDINTAGSQYLFKSVTDGVNTYTATSPDDVLTLAAAGGQTISVDPATGTMTFTSAAGTGDYFEYIFKRSATAPTKPDQADGVGEASPNDWFDAPPAADGNPLWMCTAWKASDGSFAIGVTEWDDPISIDGQGITVEYSIDGATLWHSEFTAGDLYMRQSVDGGDTWSSAIKIVGEDGDNGTDGGYLEYVFKRAASTPTKPNQADAIGEASPNDWLDAPPAADGNALYFCTALKDADGSFADGVTEWTGPVQIDGIALQVEYSIDGATDWHSTFAEGDLYMRQSTDGGATWSDAIKVVGEDGEDGTGNTTYVGGYDSPPATPLTGDTWYVTSTGGAYTKGYTYRWDGDSWEIYGNVLYNTTITAGKIDIDSVYVNPAGTYGLVNRTAISGGKIALTTDGVTGTLGTALTAAKCTDATANNTTTALEASVTITSGGIVMTGASIIRSGQTAYNTGTGYWLGIDTNPKFSIGNGTTQVLAFDSSTITITCTKGKIGSATDYFDISNGILELRSDTTHYMRLVGSSIIFTSAGGVGDLTTQYIRISADASTGTNIILSNKDAMSPSYNCRFFSSVADTSLAAFGGPVYVFQRSHNNTLGTFTSTVTGELLGTIIFRGCTSSNAIDTGSIGANHISYCCSASIYVTQDGNSGANNVPTKLNFRTQNNAGTSKVMTFDNAGTLTATTFSGSGASLTAIPASGLAAGGTFPAINGSALTALNATNLGSGTVPTARLPFGVEHGYYTATATNYANWTTIYTFTIAPTFVIIQREATAQTTAFIYAAVGDAAATAYTYNAEMSDYVRINGTALQLKGNFYDHVNAADDYHVVGFFGV